MGIRGVDGPIRYTVDLTVEPLAETRSRLTIAVEFEGHGIGKILVPLLVNHHARNEVPGNLATLKERVEARSTRAATPTHLPQVVSCWLDRCSRVIRTGVSRAERARPE
jgi:hypothetical protein